MELEEIKTRLRGFFNKEQEQRIELLKTENANEYEEYLKSQKENPEEFKKFLDAMESLNEIVIELESKTIFELVNKPDSTIKTVDDITDDQIDNLRVLIVQSIADAVIEKKRSSKRGE